MASVLPVLVVRERGLQSGQAGPVMCGVTVLTHGGVRNFDLLEAAQEAGVCSLSCSL